jgi:hypothetical protein
MNAQGEAMGLLPDREVAEVLHPAKLSPVDAETVTIESRRVANERARDQSLRLKLPAYRLAVSWLFLQSSELNKRNSYWL